MIFAVNGTLMRGLKLNGNLTEAGAVFVEEAKTRAVYRLFSIDDIHPAMYRVRDGGAEISVEIWDIDEAGLVSVLKGEPSGLCIGKVQLNDGRSVMGVLGEKILCEGMKDITEFGGWREYISAPCVPEPSDL
jgi:hypothetical protein